MVTASSAPPVMLQSGDRMTRIEFHRRYCELPDIRAQLIEGVVYLSSPLRANFHGDQHALVLAWLGVYWEANPETVRVSDNASVFLDADNEPQPDASLRYIRGQTSLTEGGYIAGAPELIVEVAASSVSIDLHDKLNAYRRNGVREYIVWRVLDQAIDWFRLHEGAFDRVEPDEQGLIGSEAFPGLRLNVAAMLAEDVAGVLKTQRDG
ncbi:MAG: Uma2 family endonuclease [Dehalococcoidia bacterium]